MNKVQNLAKTIMQGFTRDGKEYNGIVDITEHFNFAEIAERNDLTESEYESLISLCQDIADMKSFYLKTRYFSVHVTEKEIVFKFKDYDSFLAFQEDFEGWEDKREFELLAEALEDFTANSEFGIDYDETCCAFSLDEIDEEDNLVKCYRLENTQYYNIFQYLMTGKYGDYWKDAYDSCLGREMVFTRMPLD